MTNTMNEGRFAVIVICERDIMFVRRCPTEEAAIEAANQALDNWMLRAKGIDPDDIPDGEDDDWQKATAENHNAWCNYGGDNWDAHIVDMDDPEATGISVSDPFAEED